jgi:hypothetical protein
VRLVGRGMGSEGLRGRTMTQKHYENIVNRIIGKGIRKFHFDLESGKVYEAFSGREITQKNSR